MDKPSARTVWIVVAVACCFLASLLPPPVQAAAPLVSPSGAGTVVIGPQAMEGALKIHPGDTLRAGFDFTMPGSHPAATASFYNGYVALLVKCANGSTPPLTIQLASQTLTDPAGSPNWFPSGDQSSSLVYQGSLTAPDLCGGGVMDDSAGAAFTTTFFSTDTIDMVNFRFHYSDGTAGGWSGTAQGVPTPFAKSVTSATLTPTLSLGLTGDRTTAIPGDTITYTATVTNTGAALSVAGDFFASDTGSANATVASYWDDIDTSLDGKTWTPLVGVAAKGPGYTPAVAPPAASGLALSLTSVAGTGVTYPTSGDPIVGTGLASGSTAQWHYVANGTLSAIQATSLFDPTKVKRIRNSFHLEVTPANPNVMQPAIIELDFSNLFFGGAPSASLTNVNVSIQPPQGAALQFSPAATPALGLLASGASTSVSGTFKVPAAPAKGAGQTDASYFAALSALEGSLLKAGASASATATTGAVNAPAPPVVTTVEHLPIVSITKSGPPSVNAGTTETNPLVLSNSGGAIASGIAITDSVPNGANGTVSGNPATLAAGAAGNASAAYAVPASQTPGNLTDTASLTWQDANGNNYGPVSSSFTTNVANPFAGATLTLAPATAGPNAPGTPQSVTATLLDSGKHGLSGQTVTFAVTGANPTSGSAVTDANGNASFSYTGANVGTDVVQAAFTAPGTSLASNTSTITWIGLLQAVASTIVTGNFFDNPTNICHFGADRTTTPLFSQTFPNIMFNPDPAIFKVPPPFIRPDSNGVVFNISTRPFTDITTDVNGNPNGMIIAQGRGIQAGSSETNFFASFTGSFVVNQAGDVTFRILHDDGYILGVGGGTLRVSGDYDGDTVPATTPFNNYPTMAAWNTSSTGSSSSGPATVHFPAAGVYPYELDYTECSGGPLFLDLLTQSFVAQTSPLSIYVGYADGVRAAGSIFPFPWEGSPNVTFEGCSGGCVHDSGAIRIDNSGTTPAQIDSVTVDIPAAPGVNDCTGVTHFDIWPHNLTVPAGQIMILTNEVSATTCSGAGPFDTSDTSFNGCGPDTSVIPVVNVTSGGITTSFNDTKQILNTQGHDPGQCTGNESESWVRIGGGGTAINVPLPPAAQLNLTPFNVQTAIQGQSMTETVSVLDGAGNPVPNLGVTLSVFGPNAQTITGTTGTNGLVTFTYGGNLPGTDTVQATALIEGLQAVSNTGTITWTPPGGTNNPLGPSISTASPAEGAIVTAPTPISATISPAGGDSIASWSVSYQASGLAAVQIGSGSGAPPSGALATFDPTLLPNGAYKLFIQATGGNGAQQVLVTTVTVTGNLKLGRYVTTFNDLSVPVNGFQMQVVRTYDSYDKAVGDFGVGWRVSFSDFRDQPNRVLGAGGWNQYNKQCALGLCFTGFRNAAPRYVAVTWPDGHVELFDFTPAGGTNLFWTGTAAFAARAGTNTTSTLQPVGDPSLSYTGDGNLYDASGHPYDPQQFQLTTLDGKVILLSRLTGLVSIRDHNANTMSVSSSGVVASNGASIQFTRDSLGRITQVLGPSGETFHYGYDGQGNLAQVIDADTNQTTFTYDSNHDLQSTTGPGGPIQSLSYDPATGRLNSVTDAAGNTLTINSNVGARVEVISDPNRQLTTTLFYDNLGDELEQDQSFGGQTLKTLYTYDAVGHLTSITDPLGRIKRLEYDSQGNLTAQSDNAQNRSRLTYNSFGEVTSQIGPDGLPIVTLVYDSNGQLTEQQLGDGTKVDYFYDPAGHMTSYVDATGKSQQFTYDSQGHLASATDKLGRQTFYTFNASGKLTQATDGNGAPTKYTYDGMGNVTSVVDPKGGTQKFKYNVSGLIVTATDADGLSTNYTYDANNRLTLKQNRDGSTINYTYNVDGLLATKTPVGGTTTSYSYDALGRVTGMANADSTIQYTYDADGEVVSASTGGTASSPLPSVTLQYTYDVNGQIASITGPEGTTRYVYDAFHRLSQVTDPTQGQFLYAHDALGRPTQMTRPNGVVDNYTYDSLGRPLSIDSSLNGTVINRADYTYDVVGQTTSFTDLSGQSTYQHDAAGNLVSATHPSASGVPNESYSYDAVGNRIGGSTYDAANRLLNDGHFAYTHDANGELATRTDTTGTTTFAWDHEGQLTGITYPDGTMSHYRYDPLGRRVEANDNGSIHRFVYDRADIHLIYDGSNNLQVSQVSSFNADQTLEYTQGGHVFYYVRDAQATTRAITDGSGAVVASFEYNSYGVPTNTSPQAPWSTFDGREYESRSGLYLERARYYDPSTGRFISEDPLGATNLYHYAFDDPIDFTDPSGLGPLAEYLRNIARSAAIGGALSALDNIIFKQIPLFCKCGRFDLVDLAVSFLAGAVGGALFGALSPGLSWAGRGLIGGLIGAEMAVSSAAAEGALPGRTQPSAADVAESASIAFVFGALGGIASVPSMNIGFMFGKAPTGAEDSLARAAADAVFPFAFTQLPGDLSSAIAGGITC